jgi:DNA polymerase III epsilon subunit-like protein
MTTITFDVETTGLPNRKGFDLYYHPKELYNYDTSRVVQIAYVVSDERGDIQKRVSKVISPDNFLIENSHIHGISQERAQNEGKKIKPILEELGKDLEKCKLIVAHNILFDLNIVLSECYRYGMKNVIELLEKVEKYCTMSEGKRKMDIRKNPKLIELYAYYYPGEKWEQKHEAMDDVEKCFSCYKKMEL